MKEMDLLRAMNDIDDKYIEEAAPGEPVKKPLFRKYYRQFTAGAGVFAVLLFAFVWVRVSNYRMGSTASGGAVMDAAPQMAESAVEETDNKSADAGYGNLTITSSAALTFTYPESYREYTVVTEEDTEEGLAVVYRNEQGKEGLRIIFSRKQESFNANMPLDESKEEEAARMAKDAVWTDGEWTYRIVLAEEISEEELQELMNEIHQ